MRLNEDLDLYKVNYECITKILIEMGTYKWTKNTLK